MKQKVEKRVRSFGIASRILTGKKVDGEVGDLVWGQPDVQSRVYMDFDLEFNPSQCICAIWVL